MKALAGITVILAGIAPHPSGAQTISSGNDLYRTCKATVAYDQGICDGFVTGIIRGVQADRSRLKMNSPFCFRPGVTNGQATDVVIKFMDNHPAIRDQSAGGIVISALASAFPCSKATG